MSNATAIPKENNVQASTAKIIPFRQKELLLVDNSGAPFVPMKPVVEGMGLAWQTQHRKLMAGRLSSVVTMMVTTGLDGKRYEMACLPLRKLSGWLMSIHASKVRPELREDVIAYQNECDDVLWSYWNDGLAVRTHGRTAMTVLDELIGMSELNVIKGLIRDKAKAVPVEHRLSCQQTLHSRLHTRFNVPRTELIPVEQFEAACNFVAAYALEGEWLGKEQKPEALFTLDFPRAQDLSLLLHYTDWVMHRWNKSIRAGLKELNPELYNSTWEFFMEAQRAAQRLDKGMPDLVAYFQKSSSGKRPVDFTLSGMTA